MAMVVKNNMSAISTLNTLNKNSAGLSKSLAKVSSGQRVNGAADDASGYAISERMRVQVRALDQDNRNTQSGTSMMKVAEGAVSSTVDILKTLKEKVVSAANDDKTDSDRAAIQKELDQSIDQINDNANVTFNGKYLVDGSHNNAVKSGGVANTMTNESLNSATDATTSFTMMSDRNGNSLNIQGSDKITISFVKEGKTYEASVTGADNFTKLLENANASQGTVTNNAGTTSKLNEGDSMNTGTTVSFGTGLTISAAGSQEQIDNIKSSIISSLSLGSNTFTTGTAEITKAGTGVTAGVGTNTFTGIGAYSFSGLTASTTYTIGIDSAEWTAAGRLNITFKATDSAGNSIVAGSATEYSPTASEVVSALGDAKMKGADKIYGKDGILDTNDVSDSNQSAKVYTAKNSIFDASNIGTSNYIGKNRSDLAVNTADGGNAITFTSSNPGIKGQVAGVTIKVEDQYGVINKSANAVLDNFTESIQAQDTSKDNAIVLQVGTKANQAIKVGLTDMRAEALGLRSSKNENIQIGTQKQANAAINVLDNAISKALDQQTTIGSVESRLEYTSQNLTTASENVQASESTIRDADMAKEMTEYTKNNVLLQAAQSMLAQANQNSSAVLSLLQ